jgi:hypothetical protein
LLTIQAGNEMTMVSQTIRTEFGNEMDKQVASVSAELKPLVVHLQRWEDSINSINDQLVGLVDLVSLDVQQLVPWATSFAVRRLNGGVFVQNDPDSYFLDIVGPNFGSDPSGVETNFEVTLNDQPVGLPERKAPIDAIFRIKKSDIETYFDRAKLVTLPLRIKVTRKESGGIFRLWRPNVQVAPYEYKVSLLPDLAGKITIVTSYPQYKWQALVPAETQTKVVHYDTPISVRVPSPAAAGVPEPGNMKIDRLSFKLACKADQSSAILMAK